MFRIAVRLRALAALLAAIALTVAAPAAATASQHHKPHHRTKHHAHVCHIRQGAAHTDNDSDNHGGPSDGDGCL